LRSVDRGSGCRAPDNEQLADVLNRGGAERGADLFEKGGAILPAVAIDADLDQFVGVEIDIDLLENGFGQAIFRNRDDRVQAMRAGAQFADLAGR